MKTKLRIETLEARALAGGFWDPLDRDRPFLPSAPPVHDLRPAPAIWLTDLGVYYTNTGLDLVFDDAHRAGADAHLQRSADLMDDGTARMYSYLDADEFVYATKAMHNGGNVYLADANSDDFKDTDHGMYFDLTIADKLMDTASLSPPVPKPNELDLTAPVDAHGQVYSGYGSYVTVIDGDWDVFSAVAYTNGFGDQKVTFKIEIQKSKDQSWVDMTAEKIEGGRASAGLKSATFTVPDQSWCYGGLNPYCQLRWTETTGDGKHSEVITVAAYLPVQA